MTNKQTIDGVSHHWAEIEAAVRGAFEDGKKDYNGCMRERLRELRALLEKPESLDLEEPHVVGYMPDHPDGDPLITLEDHQNYVAALFARQASALKADPVGCRYRKTDRPDRCWTYCEGVKVSPWKGWEVQPLFTGLPTAQPQGEVARLAERLGEENAQYRTLINESEAKAESFSVQLAEQNALIREVADQCNLGFNMRERLLAALSTSAEPKP